MHCSTNTIHKAEAPAPKPRAPRRPDPSPFASSRLLRPPNSLMVKMPSSSSSCPAMVELREPGLFLAPYAPRSDAAKRSTVPGPPCADDEGEKFIPYRGEPRLA